MWLLQWQIICLWNLMVFFFSTNLLLIILYLCVSSCFPVYYCIPPPLSVLWPIGLWVLIKELNGMGGSWLVGGEKEAENWRGYGGLPEKGKKRNSGGGDVGKMTSPLKSSQVLHLHFSHSFFISISLAALTSPSPVVFPTVEIWIAIFCGE